jgi:pSer/pThr/pTyr-binding forkhead associated (FHA) protein
MGFYLEVWTLQGMESVALKGERQTIGRSAGCEVVVDDEKVSRSHALLEKVGDSWCIRDLSSSNGTFVNGTRIAADRPLLANEEIRVGDTRIVFRATGSQTDRRTVISADQVAPMLTAREQDVLDALCAPLLSTDPFPEPATTKTIAAGLFVSEAAVRQHLLRLYDKFAIHDDDDRRRSRLAKEAIRMGAVSR